MNKKEIEEIRIVDLIPVVVTDDIRESVADRKALAKKIAKETNGLSKTGCNFYRKGDCFY